MSILLFFGPSVVLPLSACKVDVAICWVWCVLLVLPCSSDGLGFPVMHFFCVVPLSGLLLTTTSTNGFNFYGTENCFFFLRCIHSPGGLVPQSTQSRAEGLHSHHVVRRGMLLAFTLLMHPRYLTAFLMFAPHSSPRPSLSPSPGNDASLSRS